MNIGFVGEKLELVELQSCIPKVQNISTGRKKTMANRLREEVSPSWSMGILG
jgi:hypothetical protein